MNARSRVVWLTIALSLSSACVLKTGTLHDVGTTSRSGTPGGASAGGTSGAGPDAGNPSAAPGVGGPSLGGTVGQTDGVTTALPAVAGMTNVVATLGDDSASITFEPVDGALDYRVYPLPADGDIQVGGDGSVVVTDGVYKCAGDRESPPPNVDGAAADGTAQSAAWILTRVDNQKIDGYTRMLTDATLGYVYTQPGPGLVPVYALGESDPKDDNASCYWARWGASRVKKYTTSDTERAQLLADFARDDGIVFYVPAAADSTTTQIFVDTSDTYNTYYLAAGAEADLHAAKTPAFVALAHPATGTQPLMRVYYQNNCGWSHDELVAGKERFNRAYHQGDQLPAWNLEWTGITAPTTLVVEALDRGCPYQGHLSPTSVPATTTYLGANALYHEPFVTLEDMRSASTTGEVFLNGQHGPAWIWDGTLAGAGIQLPNTAPLPKAIARAFVKVAPVAHETMDFFADFSPTRTPETFTNIPCLMANCRTWRQQSPTFDQMFIDNDVMSDNVTGLFAFGQARGEWLITYADVGSDTNGKYRLTANQKGTMAASTFLHVTLEADGYATARRYPQILISDQSAPVQDNLPNGHTLVIQPRAEEGQWYVYPIDYDLQVCNLRTWDVNNQCPQYDLYHVTDSDGVVTHLAPNDELGEHTGMSHRTRFDVYASTQRTYLFLDGQPYACANLPSVGPPPAGPVSVTWGDALYHSSVDQTFGFHASHLQIDTIRHFDNLGFSSGLPPPAWDESRFPCAAPIAL